MKTKTKSHKTITHNQKEEAKLAKVLFDLCEELGEGCYSKLHIIDTSENPHSLDGEKIIFRIYHSFGHCFDVSKEPIELAEDETNDSAIDGNEYQFNEGIYEGFNDCTIWEAIQFLINEEKFQRNPNPEIH